MKLLSKYKNIDKTIAKSCSLLDKFYKLLQFYQNRLKTSIIFELLYYCI